MQKKNERKWILTLQEKEMLMKDHTGVNAGKEVTYVIEQRRCIANYSTKQELLNNDRKISLKC